MKLKSVASLKGPLACSIILILKTYFLSLTAMPFTGSTDLIDDLSQLKRNDSFGT